MCKEDLQELFLIKHTRPYRPNNKTHLILHNLKSLKYRRVMLDLNLPFQNIHRLTVIEPNELFIFQTAKISLRRHSFRLIKKKARLSLLLHSFAYQMFKGWNALPKKNCFFFAEAQNYFFQKKIVPN